MDVEKTMQLILDAQARLFAGFDEMKAQNQEFAAQQKAASERMDRLEAQMIRQDEQAETDRQHVNSALLNLGRATLGLADHVRAIDIRLQHLVEKVDTLVDVVDGFARNRPASPPAP